MKPVRENINMPDKFFPVKIWIRSSRDEYIFAHPHWHEEFEILYIISGKATQQINDRIFNASRGGIVVIGSDAVHSTYTRRDEQNEILVLQFNIDFLKPAFYLSPEMKLLEHFRRGLEYPDVIESNTSPGVDILRCLTEIYDEFDKKAVAYELLVKAHICELVSLLTRNFIGASKKRVSDFGMLRAKDMLRNTFKLIDDNFNGELTLAHAAKTSNLSVSHFSRLFKKTTGMTFKNYLSFYRINRAEELLFTTRSITEIAFECGFTDVNSFIRTFKRYKKCTPSFYRNRK